MEPSNVFPLDTRVCPAKMILRFIGTSYLGTWAQQKEREEKGRGSWKSVHGEKRGGPAIPGCYSVPVWQGQKWVPLHLWAWCEFWNPLKFSPVPPSIAQGTSPIPVKVGGRETAWLLYNPAVFLPHCVFFPRMGRRTENILPYSLRPSPKLAE